RPKRTSRSQSIRKHRLSSPKSERPRLKRYDAMWKSITLLSIVVLFISACKTSGRVNEVVDTACNWVQPIYISREDALTDETARQILNPNEIWERACKAR